MPSDMAYDLHISGIVQGVGFRPFVYRQAVGLKLTGWVLNASDGVHVHVEGKKAALEAFAQELSACAPPAALITSVDVVEVPAEGFRDFVIRQSQEQQQASTLISPDIATCPLCLEELFDKKDRRYRYPFINCTNCGPRFTIISALPYDRPNTSMDAFAMCKACSREYHQPLDRRFHAQPDACFACGPALRLWRRDESSMQATDRKSSDRIMQEVAALICEGRIVAIKGLGGYHLACDATNEAAVQTLRLRKRRSAKPFALMVEGLKQAGALCKVSPLEALLLTGSVRPIVLLRRLPLEGPAGAGGAGGAVGGGGAGGAEPKTPATPSTPCAPSVAGGLPELGIMLPYTPVQHLLMDAVRRPLVMTSGNISEEPIISDEAQAHELLGSVADAFLDNDRQILSRYDDSVVRVVDERLYMIRRARGYAPKPLPFVAFTPKPSCDDKPELTILATGPEQKSCLCFTRGDQAFVSQHLGDLENAAAFGAWLATLGLYERLFDLDYQVIACDRHPEYLSSKWARAQKESLVEVQHHHAHIAAVLAEQKALGPSSDAGDIRLIDKVIGLAFDGTGYGDDATIWGGEVLIAGLAGYTRFAHLVPVALPGSRAAIDHPDRMAFSYIKQLGLEGHAGAAKLLTGIGPDRLLLLEQVIEKRINSPMTSSMGRLFDAVSALVGVCSEGSYEGQAAVELEAALYCAQTGAPVVDPSKAVSRERYRFVVREAEGEDGGAGGDTADGGGGGVVFDPALVFAAILDDLACGVSPALISLRFHDAVVELVAELCQTARRRTQISTVALSGGVFMNRYLLSQVVPLLESEGFTVLMNRELPANDGCIAYGQAAVAAAQLAELANAGIVV